MPTEIDFIGRYDHTLDAKNRLMIPQAFRDVLKENEKEFKFFVTRWLDKCLAMYAPSTWKEMVLLLKSRKAGEIARQETRKFLRMFYSSTVEVVPDKAGRILIPDHLRMIAGLEKKVVLIGVNDRIEIWDAQTWAKFSTGGDGEYEASASEAFGNP